MDMSGKELFRNKRIHESMGKSPPMTGFSMSPPWRLRHNTTTSLCLLEAFLEWLFLLYWTLIRGCSISLQSNGWVGGHQCLFSLWYHLRFLTTYLSLQTDLHLPLAICLASLCTSQVRYLPLSFLFHFHHSIHSLLPSSLQVCTLHFILPLLWLPRFHSSVVGIIAN